MEHRTPSVFQEASRKAQEIPLEDGMVLILEASNPWVQDTEPVFWTD